jgi:hypothetical protein
LRRRKTIRGNGGVDGSSASSKEAGSRGAGPASRLLDRLEGWSPAKQSWLLAGWSFAIHGAFVAGSPLRASPVSFLFFGDSLHFLAQGRHLARGLPFNEGLPFHPPLTAWLTAPVWALTSDPEVAGLAAKLLMAALAAATFGLLFRLLRSRVPHAFWIVALLPLGFGEMLLSSAVNSEVPYRLLLVLTLLLGWRRPLWTGALQGLAALTRAEHLPFVLGLGLLLVVLPQRWSGSLPDGGARRRFVALALAGLGLALAPSLAVSHRRLSAYNQRHAAELSSPLPTLVPVSFYGPLNFALAQREEDVYFSRRGLPPAPGGDSELDPTFEPHHRYIVDGYRLGLEAVVAAPGRFLRRTGRKAAISLGALGFGWSWRDLPHDPRWIRRPVDMARAPQNATAWIVAGLALFGGWRLRAQRGLLVAGGVLVLYRLAMNAAFFPYLRGMMIAAPFWSVLAWHGLASLAGRRARALLVTALLLVGVLHFATALRQREYRVTGERDAAGAIIDDRTVTIDWVGFAKQEPR